MLVYYGSISGNQATGWLGVLVYDGSISGN